MKKIVNLVVRIFLVAVIAIPAICLQILATIGDGANYLLIRIKEFADYANYALSDWCNKETK